MEKRDVIIEVEVIYYLDTLINKLYVDDYFSYVENVDLYVEKIYEFIEKSVHIFPHKSTPKGLLHLGANYIFYKSNARTTWYIFFEKNKTSYLVTGILNNHCSEAQLI
ncbi:Plasmid stabilization protein [Flavobacterium antarcticum]